MSRPASLCLGVLAALACVPPGSTPPAAAVPFVPRCSALCVGLRPPAGQVSRVVELERQGPNLLLADWSRTGFTAWSTSSANGDVDEAWMRGVDVPGYDNVFQAADSGAPVPTRLGVQRQDALGRWGPDRSVRFADEVNGTATFETFGRVSVTTLADTLAVCAVTGGFDFDIEAVAAFRIPGSSAMAIGDIELFEDRPATGPPPPLTSGVTRHGAGDVGDPADIACAGVTGPGGGAELHVCLVTTDGHLWHTIKRDGPVQPDGTADGFTPFGDVEGQIGEIGTVSHVDCVARAGTLHLVAVSALGGRERVWHTTRQPDGTWRASRQPDGSVAPVDDVLAIVAGGAPIGTPFGDVAAGFCHETADLTTEPLLLIAWRMGEELPYVAWTPSPRSWWPTDPPRTYSPLSRLLPPGPEVSGLRGLSLGERPFASTPAAAAAGR